MSDQLLNEKAKFEMVWEALIKLDIGAVTVEFEGSGDDGSIHSVEPDTGDERFKTYTLDLDGKAISLRQLIEELSDSVIADSGIDWYNNEGGFGEVTWHVAAPPDEAEPVVNLNELPPEPRPEPHGHYIDLEISERIVNTNDYQFEYDRHGERV